jgi:hypothetical protein
MRGANGAIVVTTKRGEPGRAKISLTHEVGFLNRIGKMQNQNAYDMAITRNRVMDLDGRAPMYTEEEVEMYRRVTNGEKQECPSTGISIPTGMTSFTGTMHPRTGPIYR